MGLGSRAQDGQQGHTSGQQPGTRGGEEGPCSHTAPPRPGEATVLPHRPPETLEETQGRATAEEAETSHVTGRQGQSDHLQVLLGAYSPLTCQPRGLQDRVTSALAGQRGKGMGGSDTSGTLSAGTGRPGRTAEAGQAHGQVIPHEGRQARWAQQERSEARSGSGMESTCNRDPGWRCDGDS